MNTKTRTTASQSVRAPGWVKLALESRAPFEYALSVAAWPVLARSPRGDGHPVIIYPGFMASDISTGPLRRALHSLGYAVHPWRQGRNVTASPEVLERALEQIRSLHKETGRKVSLVGWSLGGVYARELAKRAPKSVRCVVTLGAPFTGPARATNAWRLFELIHRNRPRVATSRDELRAPPPVPTTSIYSRTDGVVAWQCSLEEQGALAENIEVEASHTGLGVNPLVFHVLADRLSQPQGKWRPFERTGLRRLLFRDPRRPAWSSMDAAAAP